MRAPLQSLALLRWPCGDSERAASVRSGVARYGMEVQRLLDVLDQRLEGRDYIVVSASHCSSRRLDLPMELALYGAWL